MLQADIPLLIQLIASWLLTIPRCFLACPTQDIYNGIAASRRDVCEGQSSIHALASQLDDEGFWSRIQFDQDGRVTAVLFAHPESLAYLRAYPDVLLLDCTYKTNKHGMPLLDMVGQPPSPRLAHYSAYGMPIRLSFAIANPPSIGKTSQSKPDRLTIFWHYIIGSPSEDAFKERVEQFEKQYLPEYLNQVGYVKSFWLEQYKEKLVKAWVDQHTHFGNTATSRVEGIHALMKSHLKKSTLDLFEAWRAIKNALLNQLSELRSNQARQQIRVPIELSSALYGAVRGWVSHEALRKVEEQREMLNSRDLPPRRICTGSFTRSQGLPCMHAIKELLEQGKHATAATGTSPENRI
ncbi:hypothetical protein HIM_09954 [Hirsutella minnesotensis 3608]|uniref:ZSWIM1/3 RNaseH-like domain-containing protein n=1 Tax=Hirsutella minnesotensis 3608 TaxID=1043627 RepID=A0A0F8A2Q7_9HYPO|nr:hypothetical protein HIM_09954 [Hirsutella minnesotensis 3608]